MDTARETARRKAIAIAVAAAVTEGLSPRPGLFQPREESPAWRLVGRQRLLQRLGVRR